MDIFDYVKENNSELKELNILDIIILTRLSYLHLESINVIYPIKIIDLFNVFKDIKVNKNDKKLIECLKDSKRFNNIMIKRFKHIENQDLELIFTGITFSLPNNNILVSFRGTGKNIYDFKEDMNMAYKIIPSCIEGIKYVDEEKDFNKMFVSGHSKGGHIAMYSGCNSINNKDKIEKIYNFDGPGFLEITDELIIMNEKIINYFPETSIVGRLMNSIGIIIPIKTKNDGLKAHGFYNWEIENNSLIKCKLSKNSDIFHSETLKFLNIVSKEKRKIIIDHLFDLMLKGELENIGNITLDDVKKLINNIPHLEKEEKEELIYIFKLFIKCSIPRIKS